jgi:crossover junction endodeoxyribonuclease RusA
MTEKRAPYHQVRPERRMLSFTLTGRIMPYVRMTRKGMWINPRAQEYLASRAALQYQFKTQMRGEMFDRTPLIVTLIIAEAHIHTHDIDNTLKAVMDAAQGIVYKNDCWVDAVIARRIQGEEATIFEVKEAQE